MTRKLREKMRQMCKNFQQGRYKSPEDAEASVSVLIKNIEDEDAKALLKECVQTLAGLWRCYRNTEQATAVESTETAMKNAIASLSYSEQKFLAVVLDALPDGVGIIRVSQIAVVARINPTTASCCIKKLCAAGVAYSQSLGVKGKFIRLATGTELCRVELEKSLGTKRRECEG